MNIRKLVAALFAAMLLLASCGGGDSDDESSDTTEASSDDTEATDDTEASDDTASDDTTDLSDVDVGDIGGDCFEFALAYGSLFLGSLGALGGEDADVEQFQSEVEELKADVPSEIEDDFNTVSDAYAEYFDAIGDEGLLSDAAAEAGEILEENDVVEAQENIDAYVDENCS